MSLPTTPLVSNDPFLAEVQGNVLKSHGRRHCAVLLLRFVDRDARPFLKRIGERITTARQQMDEVMQKRAGGPGGGCFLVCGVSAAGYGALGFNEIETPNGPEFNQGQRARATDLGDAPVEGDMTKPDWPDSNYAEDIHAFVLIADQTPTLVTAHMTTLLAAGTVGVKLVGVEIGRGWKNQHDWNVEHFGYVDGRSGPIYLQSDLEREQQELDGVSQWNPVAPLSDVFVPSPGGGYGSYFVLRKLEQNVAGFKAAEHAIQKKIDHIEPGQSDELAGAYVIGRFEDGTPVALQSAEGMHSPVPNNFTYADDPAGAKCPFHSHVRLMNPRATGDRVMARRGITYGYRKPALDPTTHLPLEDQFDDEDRPTGGVGLLFMAYVADIAEQFEKVQKRAKSDPVLGSKDTPAIGCPMRWGQVTRGRVSGNFGGFVTTQGGEYFFAPPPKWFAAL